MLAVKTIKHDLVWFQADIQILVEEKLVLEQSLHKTNEGRSVAGKSVVVNPELFIPDPAPDPSIKSGCSYYLVFTLELWKVPLPYLVNKSR